ncbi:MAG TPA: FAD-dependent oxidoreductase, partial [Longimicrobiales bacterium]
GSQTNELSGPDLRAGVPLEELADRQPLLGHVDGEAAILVRLDDDVVAIGATCTHYSGPLGEGIVTGDVIRCPWHHACFALRTGEVAAPPALASLPSWRTEVRNGRVYVGERIETTTQRKAPAGGPQSIVIVGAGAAGMIAAETLRSEGFTGRIALVDPDADAPYDRPNLSKDFLAGNAPEEWLRLRNAEFYAEQKIDRIVAGVTAIEAKQRVATLSDGRKLNYDALLLATGATPVRLPIPGADLPHVHVLRTITDCMRLIDTFEGKPKVVIAGASFIGMEVAASIRNRGLAVTVVAPEQVPFDRVLGAELGRLLHARHESNGVEFRLGHTLKEITKQAVSLDNGERIDADVVVLGVGVRPALTLAEQAGLTVDKGVVVNEYLESSISHIFAAGDIARFPDPRTGQPIRVEHWVVAQRQGQVAARNMLGARAAFDVIPFFWTHQYDVTISYVGHAPKIDDVQIDGDPGKLDCKVSYLVGKQVMAVATINRDRDALLAEIGFEEQAKT